MEEKGDSTEYPGAEIGTFPALDGVTLYERWWRPKPEPKAGIVLVHGLAEHSGRYVPTARYLTEHGYAFDAFDLRGHGKSGGIRLFLNSFEEYLSDLDLFLDRVRARLPGRPLFLLGHSMGGVIVTFYALEREPRVRGVVLSAPAVKLSNEVSPLLQKTAAVIARFLPMLKTVKINRNFISRDPAVVEAYDSDPLNYRGGVLMRTGSELVRAGRHVRERMDAFTLPILVLQGTGDRITEPDDSRRLYENAASADRALKLYEGLYHEILNEPEKEQVLQDIVGWLDLHIRSDDR
jgi:alpha-beta hydrolase superfamily lysophospholipase